MKTCVRVAAIREMLETRRRINSIPLEDIEWVDEEGRTIPVDLDVVGAYKFTGLSNVDFVNCVLDDYENFKKFAQEIPHNNN